MVKQSKGNNEMTPKSKPRLDPKDRDPVAKRDFEDAFKHIIRHPQKETRSENREPTRKELEERHKLVKRG